MLIGMGIRAKLWLMRKAAKAMKGEDMEKVEVVVERFLGDEGEEGLRQIKTLIASGFNVVDKMRKALEAASELTDAVAHARNNMKAGYEASKQFLNPETLQKMTGLYETIKKWGILGILEKMTSKKDGS